MKDRVGDNTYTEYIKDVDATEGKYKADKERKIYT